jgi:hypothetical protein
MHFRICIEIFTRSSSPIIIDINLFSGIKDTYADINIFMNIHIRNLIGTDTTGGKTTDLTGGNIVFNNYSMFLKNNSRSSPTLHESRYIYRCIYIFIFIYIYIYTYIYAYIYIYLSFVYMFMYTCMNMRINRCLYTYMYKPNSYSIFI